MKISYLLLSLSLLAAGCDQTAARVENNIESNSLSLPEVSPPSTETPIPNLPADPPKTKSNCNENYSGCVPLASDVDCAGGKGDGPEYVKGPIRVLGNDVYGLDRDGDGIACDK
jgi:hypothetical protein